MKLTKAQRKRERRNRALVRRVIARLDGRSLKPEPTAPQMWFSGTGQLSGFGGVWTASMITVSPPCSSITLKTSVP